MKSIWDGSISFGLVNIPVKMYLAIKQRSAKARLFHKENLSPICYKRCCDDYGQEVPWTDIVKGFEVAKVSEAHS